MVAVFVYLSIGAFTSIAFEILFNDDIPAFVTTLLWPVVWFIGLMHLYQILIQKIVKGLK